ncbi:hypothetical protein [Cryobacterium cryoconiti]|uniref:Uncharacterized protein n=1 Tax=Cryobacterium cryoconiti TaxID=1259239 RepID=A0A4Y8JY51_9MICO|nr:hypothetical protein [Cryobacterium cryoconiti]TFD27525.1 hypothetical protein E3T49_13365 [Cryobacterium cryoconiti]
MTNQGNVAKRTAPVVMLRVAGMLAVLGCLIGLGGMLGQSLGFVTLAGWVLAAAAGTAVAALIVRVAR